MVDVSDLIGTKYKIHGRDKSGYDCYGLVVEVMKRYGKIMPDFEYDSYTNTYFDGCVKDVLKNFNASVKKINGYIDGAIVLFGNPSGMNTHIGVYVGDGNIIHCNKRGVHLDSVELLEPEISGVYIWQK